MLVYISNTYAPEAGAAYSAAVLADNPVAYWKMRDGASTDFRNYATTGAPAANYSTLFAGTAAITGPHPDLLQNWTIECWFNTNASGRQTLFSFVTSLNVTAGLDAFVTPGTNELGLDDGTAGGPGFRAPIALNTWHHIAYVKTGSNVTCFFNGVSVGTVAFSPKPVAYVNIGSLSVNLGGSFGYLSFSGMMSSVRITNGFALYSQNFTVPTSPLTPVTGTTLLTCIGKDVVDISGNNVSLSLGFGSTRPISFYYSPFFRNTAGNGTFADSSTTSPTALSAAPNALSSIYQGHPPLAAGLGASTFLPPYTPISINDGTTMSSQIKLNSFAQGITQELWFRFDANLLVAGNGVLIAENNFSVYVQSSPNPAIYLARLTSNGIMYYGPYILTNGQTYHVVVTNGNAGTDLFINGSAVLPAVQLGDGAPSITSPIVIGQGHSGLSATSGYDGQTFVGKISDIAVYGYELSAERVLYHYQLGTNTPNLILPYQEVVLADSPIAYWPLNDDVAKTISDSKKYLGNNALQNDAFYTTWNDRCSAPMPLGLTGTNSSPDNLRYSTSPLTPALGNSVTLGTVTQSPGPVYLTIGGVNTGNSVDKYKKFERSLGPASSGPAVSYEIWFSHNHKSGTGANIIQSQFAKALSIVVSVPASSTIGTLTAIYNNAGQYNTGAVAPNTPYHLVAILSTTGSKIYLNGVLQYTTTVGWRPSGGVTDPNGVEYPLDFITAQHIFGAGLVGTISNPAVYAYELTASQVLAHYNAGK